MTSQWFVALATGGHSGLHVSDELSYLGIACYRPRFRVPEISRGRKIWREGFLLGRYVLVEMKMKLTAVGTIVHDWAEQFHLVAGARGIRGVLCFASGAEMSPLVVLSSEVSRLRSEERGGYVPVPEKMRGGQRIRIKRGAFAYRAATYKFSCDKFDYVTIDGLAARVVRLPRGLIETF